MSRDNDGDEFVGFNEEPSAAEPETPAVEPETEQPPEDEPPAEVNDETDEPEKAEDDDEPEKGKRNKPAHKRIDELTKARREAERERDELRQKLAALEGGKQPETQAQPADLVEPNPDEFEFGEADPAYLKALAKYEVKTELAEERQRNAAATGIAAAQAEAKRLNANWEEMAAKAEEKYPDFKETVIESAAASEWPLLPLSAAAVAGSDNGDDIAYHLATNKADATKLADLENQFHVARDEALKAGLSPQLVGLFTKPYFDRATEFFESIAEKAKPTDSKPKGKVVTDAPTPPEHRSRGSSGRYETDFSDENVDLDKVHAALRR